MEGVVLDLDEQVVALLLLVGQLDLVDPQLLVQLLGGLGCVVQLLEPERQLLDLLPDFLLLLVKELAVAHDKLDVVGGGHVVGSLEEIEHLGGELDDGLVGLAKEGRNGVLLAFFDAQVFQVLLGDFDEGLFGPGHEPDHGGVVDEARVLSDVVPEGVA